MKTATMISRYSSMTVDNDGSGLNSCGLSHGDALHLEVRAFKKWASDMVLFWSQGTVGAALRDARKAASDMET